MNTSRTRRKFLFDCSVSVAALALAPGGSTGRSALAGDTVPATGPLHFARLAGQVNTPFQVQLSSGQLVSLTLLDARLTPPTPIVPGRRLPGDAGNEKFSLIFRGPKESLLASAIHRFEHDQLGRFEIYIGEIGRRDMDSVRYEAVFNRPAPTAYSQTPPLT